MKNLRFHEIVLQVKRPAGPESVIKLARWRIGPDFSARKINTILAGIDASRPRSDGFLTGSRVPVLV
jgi:hypothetical protein